MSNERNYRTPDQLIELGQQINELEAAIRKSQQRDGRNEVVTEAKTYSAVEARNMIEHLRQEWAIEVNQIKRRAEEEAGKQYESYVDTEGNLRHRQKGKPDPLLLDPASTVKLFGERAFAKLSAEQRADAYSLRESDLDGFNLRSIFGPGSSSAKAQSLAASSPAKYRILRNRAIEQQIL